MKKMEPATIPQAAKLLSQFGNVDKVTMQRLLGGIGNDIAHADLTCITRFDLANYLNVVMLAYILGPVNNQMEYSLAVDNEAPLDELLERVSAVQFGRVIEESKGPDTASFFLLGLRKSYPTLKSARLIVESYDLKLASAREMATFSLQMGGVLPVRPYGSVFHLCGSSEFASPRWPHLLFFECSVAKEKMGVLEHKSCHDEDFDGERSCGWREHPRAYLVRRMTPAEIKKRLG